MIEPSPLVTETDMTPWLSGRSFSDWREQFDRDGYLIFENVLDGATVDGLKAAMAPHLAQNLSGRNDFEGLKTNRVYSLPAKSPLFAELAIHPLALGFAEAELGSSCLLSACLAINLQPGESVQPWHTDDAHIEIPYPRPSYGVSTFWSLDETTEENGATEVLPGSHLWSAGPVTDDVARGVFTKKTQMDVADDPAPRPDAVKAVMPAGSFMVAKGSLWHRGGANRTDTPRLIITPQYCPGWARPLENMMASTPKDIAARLPKRARELLGYSLHLPFMGYTDGRHPEKLLGDETA